MATWALHLGAAYKVDTAPTVCSGRADCFLQPSQAPRTEEAAPILEMPSPTLPKDSHGLDTARPSLSAVQVLPPM